MAFKNLKAEMTRIGVRQGEVAAVFGMTQGNLNKKINESVPMTIQEAIEIKARFFPDLTLDYLFESDASETSDGAGE